MKKLLAILLGITMLFGMAVTGTAEAATGADVKGTDLLPLLHKGCNGFPFELTHSLFQH